MGGNPKPVQHDCHSGPKSPQLLKPGIQQGLLYEMKLEEATPTLENRENLCAGMQTMHSTHHTPKQHTQYIHTHMRVGAGSSKWSSFLQKPRVISGYTKSVND